MLFPVSSVLWNLTHKEISRCYLLCTTIAYIPDQGKLSGKQRSDWTLYVEKIESVKTKSLLQ